MKHKSRNNMKEWLLSMSGESFPKFPLLCHGLWPHWVIHHRLRLYQDFRGYIASKKRYFYGLHIHILVTEQGEPVEFFLQPGAFSDTSALGLYAFDIPEGSFVTGDKAYNNYAIEDIMREAGIELIPLRKKNSHRPVPAFMTYFQASIRKVVETTGSLIERLLPKSIHAVTAKGFEIKVALFVLACSINFLW